MGRLAVARQSFVGMHPDGKVGTYWREGLPEHLGTPEDRLKHVSHSYVMLNLLLASSLTPITWN